MNAAKISCLSMKYVRRDYRICNVRHHNSFSRILMSSVMHMQRLNMSIKTVMFISILFILN